MNKVVVIVGPTASGKSAVAIELAKLINAEVISADSMQVYRGMDIGTAKVTEREAQGVPHHLIDIVDPTEPFSVAEYQRLARQAIEDISTRGKLPIVAGGTGLYIRAVIDKFEFPEGDVVSPVREELQERARLEGAEVLYQELINKDPEAAKIVHPKNVRRVIRALEAIELTGRPFSEFHREWQKRESIYNVRMFGLNMDRQLLYERINRRVDQMIESGLLSEAQKLVDAGYEKFLTSQQAIGYKELIGYLNGEMTLDEAVDLLKTRTRQYAKRQLTWFKADPRIEWLDVTGSSASEVAQQIRDKLEAGGFSSAKS